MMRAAPPIEQCAPMRVLPATAAHPAIAVCAPMRTLWPIWIWLSSLTPSSITVSSSAPRSIVVLAPISTSSPMTARPVCGILTQRPAPDMTARTDRGGCGNFGARFDHRARMNSRNGATLRAEKLRGPSVIDIGVVAQDPRQGRRVPLLARQDHGRGAGAAQLRAVPSMRKEAKVSGAGAFQGGDSPDLGIGIAYQLPAKPGDDFAQPVSTRDGLRHG